MTAFEVVADTFIDEAEITVVENLPPVIDQRNPYHFSVDFENGVWKCEAFYTLAEDHEKFACVRKMYSPETVAVLSTFYEEKDNYADVTINRYEDK